MSRTVPNWTPRISGVLNEDGSVELSILKSDGGDESDSCRYFFRYETPPAGAGRFISTYAGDGNPLPSFDGEPVPVAVTGGFDDYALAVWDALNEDNRVSLFAFEMEPGGPVLNRRIFNKNK